MALGTAVSVGRLAVLLLLAGVALTTRAQEVTQPRLDRLEAEVARAESVSAIRRLQRSYGYYLDKGKWSDLAALFTDDAVAGYPAGVCIGRDSIRKHFFLNPGGGTIGENGLGDGRPFDHLNTQPVVHMDPGSATARGRWRAFAMMGRFGDSAVWAEGVYEVTYRRDDAVWRIQTLDYYPGFAAPYENGWVDHGEAAAAGLSRELAHPPDRGREVCPGFPAACMAPFHYDNPGTSAAGQVWTDADLVAAASGGGELAARTGDLDRRIRRLSDEQAIENLQRIYGYYLNQGLWDQAAALFADDATLELGLRGVYRGRDRIERLLSLSGPDGGADGWLNDRIQLQPVVSVAADGLTARSRSRELAMTGVYESHGEWSAGIYENRFVKVDGRWLFSSVRFFPTFVADYAQGWAVAAALPRASCGGLPAAPQFLPFAGCHGCPAG